MLKVEADLISEAKMVLDFNWTGEYTKPGPRLYPHQWSWDSALFSIGYSHYDQERATRELTHLLDAQWENGFLPQIVFNPHFGTYFPGIDFWHASESPEAPAHVKTSGIVQPPVHSTAALRVYQSAEDTSGAREFLEYAFPRLAAWHEYLYRERDPEREGLVYIRHPWESGMDNSPMWDSVMERMWLSPEQIPEYRRVDTHVVASGDRPLDAAYDRFAYLVKLFADRGYDEAKIRGDCPFLVQDVLFNALLCQADKDLAQIAWALGEDAAYFEERAEKSARAMNEKLWDEEHAIYLDFDLAVGRSIYSCAAPNLAPSLREYPTKGRRGAWWACWRGRVSASPTRASRPCPATIATASRSPRPGTGAGRSGSTSTGSSRRVWIATATRTKPGACESRSFPSAAMRATTSTLIR